MKIRKPMRLEESLIDKVNELGKGDTFTAKMEYILDDYFNSANKRKLIVKNLDDEIEGKRKKLEAFGNKLRKAEQTFNDCLNELRWY